MDTILNDKRSNFSVVVNEDIGFENLEYLKNVCKINKNIVLCSLNSTINNSNSYKYGLTDNINSINSCNDVVFIFSLNPKLESAVVNTRVRTKYRNTLLTLINLNLSYSYNIPTKFVNLNLLKSLQIFEGNYEQLSNLCIRSESPLILISDLFNKRGLNTNDFVHFMQLQFNTIKIIKINKSCNTESLYFLNIKNNVKNNNKCLRNIFCLNLEDNYTFRKQFLNAKNELI